MHKFEIFDDVRNTIDRHIYTILDKLTINEEPYYKIRDDSIENLKKIVPEETIVEEKYLQLIARSSIKIFRDAETYCITHDKSYLVKQFNEIYKNISVEQYNYKGFADIFAYCRLRIVTCAINKGWEPNINEQSYFPIFKKDGDIIIESTDDFIKFPKLLTFKTPELARYAILQFPELYYEFYRNIF